MKHAIKLTAISVFLLFMSLSTTNAWANILEIDDSLNHFQCYDVKDQEKLDPPPIVSLTDKFSSQEEVEVDGKNAKKYCTPVDKNFEGVVESNTTLLCYKVEKNKVDVDVTVVNQFNDGEPQEFTLKQSRFLCVPSQQLSPEGVILPPL